MLGAPGVAVVAPGALAQNATATADVAYVLAVRGDMVTLSTGTDKGAQVGAIYQIARDNQFVQLRITQVEAAQSLARISAVESAGRSLVITVGDTATFVGPGDGNAPASPTAPATPATPLPPQQPTLDNATNPGENPPNLALVTGVSGQDISLGAGSDRGMKLGAVYVMPAQGDAQARMIVVEVSGDSARARLLSMDDGFVPVVGENARFDSIETVPADLLAPPPEVVVTPTQPTVVLPDTGTTGNIITATGGPLIKPAAMAPGEISGRTASVIAIDGQNVTLDVGMAQGASVGQNVPILRGGAVIGLVRIESATSDTSLATVVYSDAAQGALRVGDAAGLIAPSSGVQAPVTLPAIGLPNAPVPSVRVRFESGASNIIVPKADATYELLAGLAARGLIKSQPARVFQDDGARRHNVSEDINFSHAQIAGFIAEALSNSDGEKGRDNAALAILVKQYRRDLQDLNVPTATLDALDEKGFQLGVSGYTRLTAVGGDTGDNSRDPNDSRWGQTRRKSGLDTRTNVFGTITSKLSFYASLDAGTAVRNGEPFGEIASNSFRKAYVDYDAGSLLRGLTIRVGRQEYWWGPGHYGTGVLSDAAGGLDSISTSFKRGSYELRGLYAYLGNGAVGKRSFYAQDINVRIGKSARVGVNTSVLTPNKSFNSRNFVTAFTPYPLYYSRKDTGEFNSNAVVSAYGEMSVARGARVYGEIVLDDLSTNEKNSIANRAGSIFGAHYNDPKDPSRLGADIEYSRFAARSYLYIGGQSQAFAQDYSYYYRGAPLGYSIAPIAPTLYGGSENLRFDGYIRVLPKLTLFGGLQYADLNSQDQDVPGPQGFQRQRVVRAAATYDLNKRFSLTARYLRVTTDQPNFTKPGPTLKNSIVSLAIGRSF